MMRLLMSRPSHANRVQRLAGPCGKLGLDSAAELWLTGYLCGWVRVHAQVAAWPF